MKMNNMKMNNINYEKNAEELKRTFNEHVDNVDSAIVLLYKKDIHPGIDFFGKLEHLILLKEILQLKLNDLLKESVDQ
jgi:hypothetical protein